MVHVYTNTYNEIFKKYLPISVPEYQRPYRWSTEKVEDLLGDLEEFFIKKPTPGLEYYLGSILFYHNKKERRYEIVDGQQRLTTLTLIQYVMEGCLAESQNLTYNNHLSFYNIKKNIEYLQTRQGLLQELKECNFLSMLRLTVTVSTNEDNAFAFFDSQNNRGVTLGADDFLKAYHLREVVSEQLQEKLAQEWEKTVFAAQKQDSQEAGLIHLFYKILYRARKWKGQTRFVPEDKDPVLQTFQKQTRKSPDDFGYELFPGRVNQKFKSVRVDEKDTIRLLPDAIKSEAGVDFPFTLRQPLYKGHNFFLYTQKYYNIRQLLFADIETTDSAIIQVRQYYKAIYTDNMSVYLKHYMQLCLIMYYDTFGSINIYQAVQYFDYLIGSIRIKKHYVKKEAVKNSLMDYSNNLLDVVANAYLPEEVFDFIAEQVGLKETYENAKIDNDNGVRNSYKNRVLKYYGVNETTLKNRLEWIK